MANDVAKKPKTEISDIEWGAIDGNCSEFETVYPRLQWVHGDPRASEGIMKQGGFFIAKEQYPNFSGEGFTAQTLVTSDGKEIAGYGAKEAKLAVIRIKTQWTTDDNGKNVPLLQALCYVKGCEDLLCLSLKGASKSLAFNKQFQLHIAQNVATANKTRPAGANGIEPMALWFPVRAGKLDTITAKDGRSSSKVTYPEINQPADITREYVVSLFVGGANYKNFTQAWRDTKQWQSKPILDQKPQETGELHDSLDGTINDEQVKQLLDLAMAKNVIERDFCLTLTSGETDSFDALRKSEFAEAKNRLMKA